MPLHIVRSEYKSIANNDDIYVDADPRQADADGRFASDAYINHQYFTRNRIFNPQNHRFRCFKDSLWNHIYNTLESGFFFSYDSNKILGHEQLPFLYFRTVNRSDSTHYIISYILY